MMELSLEVQQSLQSSVLCWLATVSKNGEPNVTPKEAFIYDDTSGHILIANIASPNSVANIQSHPKVCVSFIDVFIQKGFKVKGTAQIVQESHEAFERQHGKLEKLIGTQFKILSIIEITPEQIDPIIAPSYRMFKGVNEEAIIAESLEIYKVTQYTKRVKKTQTTHP